MIALPPSVRVAGDGSYRHEKRLCIVSPAGAGGAALTSTALRGRLWVIGPVTSKSGLAPALCLSYA